MLKRNVLESFKSIHQARKTVFKGDVAALESFRLKVNEEYKKHKNIHDTDKIKEMIQFAKEVETELRTTVIQAVEVKPGKFEAYITPETLKLDNVPFRDTCDQQIGEK